jgi:LPS O-antigen subunit length determinant protein (WzzB/FepE family)
MNVDPINTNYKEEDSIDIIALLKKVWRERILIIKTSISFFLIGFLVAILSPVEYTSNTTFVPQVSGDDMSISNRSQLGSLASLAGINLNHRSNK